MTGYPRTRTQFQQKTATYVVKVNGVQSESSVKPYWTDYSWMADSINPIIKNKGYRPPGYCQHIRLKKTYVAPSVSYLNNNDHNTVEEVNPDVYGSTGYWHNQSPTGSSEPWDYGYSNLISDFLSSPRFSDLCFEAWNKLKTQVPTEVELLNFIYELKDFRELGKSLSKAPSVLGKSTGSVFTKPLKGKGKVKRAAKAVNDTFLSYNFMWAPFVSDLVKLTQVADKVAQRMAFLRATRGKEVTVRFIKEDCFLNPNLNTTKIVYENSGWVIGPLMTKYACDFVVTCKLYQDLEGLDDAWADLRATFAALGINNPAKAVWQAIPFSFLLDWVAPFGKWFEKAAIQPFKGTWNVYDITTSVRERGEFEFWRHGKDGSIVSGSHSKFHTLDFDRYIRLVGLPQTLGAVDFSQLTSQQQKLFLSLVLTKVL